MRKLQGSSQQQYSGVTYITIYINHSVYRFGKYFSLAFGFTVYLRCWVIEGLHKIHAGAKLSLHKRDMVNRKPTKVFKLVVKKKYTYVR